MELRAVRKVAVSQQEITGLLLQEGSVSINLLFGIMLVTETHMHNGTSHLMLSDDVCCSMSLMGQRDTATGPLRADPMAGLPDSASSCSPLPESRLCLALLTTGCSDMNTADRDTIRGNRAVRPKTPRGPYASTRAPLK